MGLTPTPAKAGTRRGARGRWPARLFALAALCGAPAFSLAASAVPERVRELAYGEVLFQHYKQDYFAALTHLLAAQEKQLIEPGNEDTELLRIGIELSYGLHENALAAFDAMLERLDSARAAPQSRDAVWLSLARTWIRRGYPERAEAALSRIGPDCAAEIAAERALLHARLLSARGDDAAAAEMLATVQSPPLWAAYAQYNRIVALHRLGRDDEALEAWKEPVKRKEREALMADPELRLLRDHAQAALGDLHLAAGRHREAETAFRQVGAGSAATGQALLGSAAAAFERGDTGQAMASWDELGRHGATLEVSHEARLMAARARWRLGEPREAVTQYRNAAAELDREIADIDAAIAGIRADGSFARLIESGEQDRNADRSDRLPAVYDTPYLAALVAEDGFHEAWNAYRSLRFLRRHLDAWAGNMSVFDTMLATRRQAYARHLPQTRERLATLDVAALETEAAAFHERIARIERDGDAFALATPDERRLAERIAGIEARIARHGDAPAPAPEISAARDRLRILKGMQRWDIERDYKARLRETRKAAGAVDAALARVREGRERLLQAQREAPSHFEGFDARIAELSARIAALRQRLIETIAGHEQYLQTLTVGELERQRARAGVQRMRARYELAGVLDDIGTQGVDGSERQPALEAWLAFADVAADDAARDGGDDAMVMHAMRRIADLRLMLAEEATAASTRDAGLRTSIESYEALLRVHPDYPDRDGLLYQLARAHDGLGESDVGLGLLTQLAERHPDSPHYAEAQFRRGETLFVQRRYAEAEDAYGAVVALAERPRFHRQARYKRGWTLFKQSRYEEALDDFVAVLDESLAVDPAEEPDGKSFRDDLDALPRAERELAADTLRVIGLSFSYLDGPRSVGSYLGARPPLPYEHLIYNSLAELYLEKERYNDAAQAYAGFVARNPDHRNAPLYQIRVFETYDKAGFAAPALAARRDFLTAYGPRSAYWTQHDMTGMPQVVERMKQELLAMAKRSHAAAQASRAPADRQAAARWYRDYVDHFPQDGESPRLSFLLAELLTESGEHAEAIVRYESSAYDHAPHAQAAEAGYAALLSYPRLIATLGDAEEKAVWQEQAVVSALRFADSFPEHPQTAAVLARTAEQLYAQHQQEDAVAVATRLLQREPPADAALRRSAWTVIGHVRFEQTAYVEAEAAYASALATMGAPTSAGDASAGALIERQAAAIYQQGAAILATDAAGAAEHFLRVGRTAPGASIVETAEYDAAAALISVQAWERAIPVLERFRAAFPASRWQGEVTRKLAVALLESGALERAAEEFDRLGRQQGDPETARAALWQSAELYQRAQRTDRAIQAWQRYLGLYPRPLDEAMQARLHIADAWRAQRNDERYRHWLNEIVAADAAAGAERSDFSRETAAGAALALAEPLRQRYSGVRLTAPLDRSLKAKREAMDQALKAYRRAADYGVASITTAATYHIGEIYHELSRALLDSQRPDGLSADELEQYDILLEEQAYPFEEEAIALHELNHRRIGDGLYDDWVQRSMEQLRKLLPARYGKDEVLVSAIETVH